MGRPRAFDRDDVVDLAMHAFWRDGYRASSVRALAAQLGMTRSSLYHAFGSREALFALALERYLATIPEAELFTLTPDDPLKPALSRVFRTLCRTRARDPERRGCLAASSIAELLPAEDDAGEHVQRAADRFLKRLEQLVRRAVTRGELPADIDVRTTALGVQTLLIGLNMQSRAGRSERSLRRIAQIGLRGLGLGD